MKLLMNNISKGLLSPVYIFWGAERYLLEQAVSALTALLVPAGTEAWNLEVFYSDNADAVEIVNSALTASFFNEKKLILVKNPLWLGNKKSKNQEDNGKGKSNNSQLDVMLEYLKNPCPATCLVMIADETIDKRRKIITAVNKQGRVVEFTPLKGMELTHWLKQQVAAAGKKIAPEASNYLAVACGGKLAIAVREINKLVAYVGERELIRPEDARAVVSKNTDLSIFDMIDAVAAKKPDQALTALEELLLGGEAEQKILIMLANQFRTMLQVKSLADQGCNLKSISGSLELHPFVVEKAFRNLKYFTVGEMMKALDLLLQADIKNKTGQGELKNQLETVLLMICSQK